ncbi:MAG: dipeptidase [Proteobacteria bacterium]|nr:dipeptidase [Pseudomonadota bacterium]
MRTNIRWLFLLLLAAPLVCSAAPAGTDYAARVARVLKGTPLIDGHNDLPWEIRDRFQGKVSAVDLATDTSKLPYPADGFALMTDIARLHRGGVGGQFWSVFVPVTMQGPVAVQATLEQIDIVRQMAERYPQTFELAYTAADVRRIHKAGRIASLMGIEGGHQIDNSLPVLREMYVLGARYLTLTHSSNTEWADSATDAPRHHGLTPFGREVVREMNRLGMMVDISHVSAQTMRAVLEVAEAPVMFSHSSARGIVDHPRDVPDDVLRMLPKNGGVVMVNFYPGYVSAARNRWDADYAAEKARYDSPPFGGIYIGQPERAKAALEEWVKAHPAPVVTLAQVADHIEYVRKVAGIDHVGLGSDFDGIPATPVGLEGVDKYPDLLAELMRRGWSDQEVAKLAGENILRALATAENVSARLRTTRKASEATIQELDGAAQATH